MIGEKRIPETISDVKVTCYNKNIINVSFIIFKILQSHLRRVRIDVDHEINRTTIEKADI